jgi:SpoIID/LytB domain protein
MAATAAVIAAGGLLGLAVPAATADPGVPVVHLEGRGHGHGVGMSQRGAEAMAARGRSAGEILGTFYPGTTIGEAAGLVRVAVHSAPAGAMTLAFPDGGEVRSGATGAQPAGFPVHVPPGGKVRITAHDAGIAVEPLVVAASGAPATPFSTVRPDQQSCSIPVLCPPPTGDAPTDEGPAPGGTTPPATSPPAQDQPGGDRPGGGDRTGGGSDAPPAPRDHGPPPTQPAQSGSGQAVSGGPVWAVPASVTTVIERGRTYRGALEVLRDGPGLRALNQLDVEVYLRGIAEVPGSWPPAAVQAQAVAARTYALRAMQVSGEICDTQRCQVYIGVAGENPGQDAAVGVTRGRVLLYGGALATAVYSADAGGVSATTFEGFGTPDGVYPYLRTVRYEQKTPDQGAWEAQVALEDVARRVGYPGRPDRVEVTETGPSGRAVTVTVSGDAGDLEVDGRTFASVVGLRSTLFRADTTVAGESPEAPAPLELQAFPGTTEGSGTLSSGAAPAAADTAGRSGDALGSPVPGAPDLHAQRAARVAAGRWAVLALAVATALALRVVWGQPFELAPRRGTLPAWMTWRILPRR